MKSEMDILRERQLKDLKRTIALNKKSGKSELNIECERALKELKRDIAFNKEYDRRAWEGSHPILSICKTAAEIFLPVIILPAAIEVANYKLGNPLGLLKIELPKERLVFEVDKGKCEKNNGVTIITDPLYDGEGRLIPEPKAEIFCNTNAKRE